MIRCGTGARWPPTAPWPMPSPVAMPLRPAKRCRRWWPRASPSPAADGGARHRKRIGPAPASPAEVTAPRTWRQKRALFGPPTVRQRLKTSRKECRAMATYDRLIAFLEREAEFLRGRIETLQEKGWPLPASPGEDEGG